MTVVTRNLPLLAVGTLAVGALLGCWRLYTAVSDGMSTGHDLVQDYASMRYLAEGRNPYEPYNDITQRLFGGPPHRGNLYSFHTPSSLIFFVWMIPLSYQAAFVTWAAVLLGCLGFVCGAVSRALGLVRPWLIGGLAALALIALPAIRENFEEGQLNIVVLAGMVGCWLSYRRGQRVWAGILLGAAFGLKPIPGLLFVYFAWRREWRVLAASMATLGTLYLIGLALAGTHGFWLYFTINYPDHANVWPGYPDNASIRGFLTRLFGPIPPRTWRPAIFPLPFVSLALWAAAGGLLALIGWWATRPWRGSWHELGVLCSLTLLITPIVWPHYMVVLIPTVVVAFRELLWRSDRRPAEVIAAAALIVAFGRLASVHYAEPWRGDGGLLLVALIVVYAAACYAAWRQRAASNPLATT
jgi:alpha-1,2-mannosyltransferase